MDMTQGRRRHGEKNQNFGTARVIRQQQLIRMELIVWAICKRIRSVKNSSEFDRLVELSIMLNKNNVLRVYSVSIGQFALVLINSLMHCLSHTIQAIIASI